MAPSKTHPSNVQTNTPKTDINHLVTSIYEFTEDPTRIIDLYEQLQLNLVNNNQAPSDSLAKVVLSHVQRALRLGAARTELQRERMQLTELINTISPPIFMIDTQCKILSKNQAAQKYIKSSHYFKSINNYLVCKDEGLLQKILQSVEKQQYSWQHYSEGDTENSIYTIYAYKTDNRNDIYSIVILNKNIRINQAIRFLAMRYSLTDREAEILTELIMEPSLQRIAINFNIQLTTLRQHIKHIHSKTHTHHHGALIALVLKNLVIEQCASSKESNLLAQIQDLSVTHILKLESGKNISYTEIGDLKGIPVFHFHSLNSSRLELLQFSSELKKMGVRLITMDRSGYGYSTLIKRNDYREYVSDVKNLLDALGLQSVYGLSASGGCAYMLTASVMLKKRFRALSCMAAVPPKSFILESNDKSVITGLINQFFTAMPSLFKLCLELIYMGQTVESVLTALTRSKNHNVFHLSPKDVDFINSEEQLPYHTAFMVESMRQGTHSFVMESIMVNKEWPFELNKVTLPVHFWHGTHDKLVSPNMIERFSDALPNATTHIIKDETHLITYRMMPEVLRRMLKVDCGIPLSKTNNLGKKMGSPA